MTGSTCLTSTSRTAWCRRVLENPLGFGDLEAGLLDRRGRRRRPPTASSTTSDPPLRRHSRGGTGSRFSLTTDGCTVVNRRARHLMRGVHEDSLARRLQKDGSVGGAAPSPGGFGGRAGTVAAGGCRECPAMRPSTSSAIGATHCRRRPSWAGRVNKSSGRRWEGGSLPVTVAWRLPRDGLSRHRPDSTANGSAAPLLSTAVILRRSV